MNVLYYLKNIWNKLTYLGVPVEDSYLKKRILLTNRFSILMAITAVYYVIIWYVRGVYSASLINLIVLVIFSSLPYLNSRKYYTLTRFILLGSFNTTCYLISLIAANFYNSHVVFLTLPVFSFLLFGLKEVKSLVVSLMIPIIFYSLLFFSSFQKQIVEPHPMNPYWQGLQSYIIIALNIFLFYFLSKETEKAENELRISNEKLSVNQTFLKSIIDNIPLIFYARDKDSRFTLVNPEFEKKFNISSGKTLSKTSEEILDKEAAEFLALHDKEIKQNVAGKTFEAKTKTEESEKTYLITKFPIIGTDNELQGVSAIANDITERIEAQKRLDEQRTLVLHNMKLSALGDMANGMAHEINNPLATSTLVIDKLRRHFNNPRLTQEEINKAIDSLSNSNQRITTIVQALRKFIGDTGTLEVQILDMNEVVHETLDLCREKFKLANIDLQVEPSQEPAVLKGHSDGLRQVIYSLLDNAYDAVLNAPKRCIKIKTSIVHNIIQVKVSDTGPGIKKEHLTKLFQPFFTTKDVGKGQGLNLSVSKGIIQSHNGTIFLDPTSSETSFVIELPLHSPA